MNSHNLQLGLRAMNALHTNALHINIGCMELVHPLVEQLNQKQQALLSGTGTFRVRRPRSGRKNPRQSIEPECPVYTRLAVLN